MHSGSFLLEKGPFRISLLVENLREIKYGEEVVSVKFIKLKGTSIGMAIECSKCNEVRL